ncbi:hypothetical protein PSZ67_23795, partial [Shigella sonnei]|nr:hypothetical protein [Shigella sonnei]
LLSHVYVPMVLPRTSSFSLHVPSIQGVIASMAHGVKKRMIEEEPSSFSLHVPLMQSLLVSKAHGVKKRMIEEEPSSHIPVILVKGA